MKRILITGARGYIGSAFRRYMEQFPDAYEIDAVSLRGDAWQQYDFSPSHVILHAAGLAHIKETRGNTQDYYTVNRDLTARVAQRAKAAGVGQFIFLSSMSVYGMDEGTITPQTVPQPKTSYGKSKLAAEQILQAMQTDLFRVAILRPPMVYGPGCKGNYQTLEKLARRLPICPDYKNRRSMISIDHLCAAIRYFIDSEAAGVFCPQDPEYVCTYDMMRQIAKKHGKHLPLTKALNFGPALLRRFTAKGRKAFGDLIYCDESKRSDASLQFGEVYRGGNPVGAGSDLDRF